MRVPVAIVVLLALGLVVPGCNKTEPNPHAARQTDDFQPAPKPKTRNQRKPADEAAAAKSGVEQAAHREVVVEPKPATKHDLAAVMALDQNPLEVPQVLLTQAEADTCKVNVGDAMPNLALVDADGSPRNVQDLFGQNLTVVAFWTSGHVYAMEELGDLEADILEPYAEQGLRVIAINTADDPQAARDALIPVRSSFPVLFDTTGDALAQVATAKLPRTYLVDASGQIVWFDIEYSRSTRRELQRAIRALLAQE